MIIVRGGGDIATGTIHRLYKSGYCVLILETDYPSAIRRHVSFCQAIYDGKQEVEGITCFKANSIEEAKTLLEQEKLVILVDPEGDSIKNFECQALIDGILAKKNLGTNQGMAPLTIALGPGFVAGKDVDFVIETMRGHDLGKIIKEGEAIKNTGIPGDIKGYSKERVIHSPSVGTFYSKYKIGDIVSKNEEIASIKIDKGNVPVYATMDGLLRGVLQDGYPVTKGFKIMDIDPRLNEIKNCITISDKARCIAGSVLEVLLENKIYPKGKQI